MKLEIYKHTKNVLKSIIPRLTKGSVLEFGELNDHDSLGEILGVIEKNLIK